MKSDDTEKKQSSQGPVDPPASRRTLLWILAAAGAGVVLAGVAAAVLVSVTQRQSEAKNPFFRVVDLDEKVSDPAVWGKNFPLQYDGYRRTVDQQRTRFGGSEAVPRAPTNADPRSVVAQSRLAEDPRLVSMWAGYAFSVDFREERGHAYMLDDQVHTERQQVVKQPGTCLNCHASMVAAYAAAGGGDLQKGFDAINAMPYGEARKLVAHPVACLDCHDPATMALRVTRPAFMAGIRAQRAAAGQPDYDVNRDATHQELRSFVCGQCHVEYYFQGKEKRLVYPWAKGLRADQIFAYYEEVGHTDWTHKRSGAKALKAQHPEFELWNQGIHARSGVSCADCHMPYQRVGALKISDHHVRSPLLNVNNACQTCHKQSESELVARVELIQTRTFELRNRAMDAVVALIADLESAVAAGRPEAELLPARALQRQAQFYLDFIEAENSMGFHAPQEAARLLAISVDLARQGQLALARGPATAPAAPAATAPAPAPAATA
ncbi:MAG TPA: ammonia-forming cytochrome c nitrite reductase subunit c552, partial [Kofleriaceae bacterium]|nr:ammonia-forming cytochrome c nitrite reductase subunit c552 [Kofleriaceae bacterium]